MCVCMCVCICICICIHTYVYICIYKHVCMYDYYKFTHFYVALNQKKPRKDTLGYAYTHILNYALCKHI